HARRGGACAPARWPARRTRAERSNTRERRSHARQARTAGAPARPRRVSDPARLRLRSARARAAPHGRRLRRAARDQLRPRGRTRRPRRPRVGPGGGTAVGRGGGGLARPLAPRPVARGLREAPADVSIDTLHVITRLTVGGSAENTVATMVALEA